MTRCTQPLVRCQKRDEARLLLLQGAHRQKHRRAEACGQPTHTTLFLGVAANRSESLQVAPSCAWVSVVKVLRKCCESAAPIHPLLANARLPRPPCRCASRPRFFESTLLQTTLCRPREDSKQRGRARASENECVRECVGARGHRNVGHAANPRPAQSAAICFSPSPVRPKRVPLAVWGSPAERVNITQAARPSASATVASAPSHSFC